MIIALSLVAILFFIVGASCMLMSNERKGKDISKLRIAGIVVGLIGFFLSVLAIFSIMMIESEENKPEPGVQITTTLSPDEVGSSDEGTKTSTKTSSRVTKETVDPNTAQTTSSTNSKKTADRDEAEIVEDNPTSDVGVVGKLSEQQ